MAPPFKTNPVKKTQWRITHNSGFYRIEYLERGRRSALLAFLLDLPKEDVWRRASSELYDSFENAEKAARLRFGKWEPLSPGGIVIRGGIKYD